MRSYFNLKGLVFRTIATAICSVVLLQSGCGRQATNALSDENTIERVKAVVAKSLKTNSAKLDVQKPLARQEIKIDELDLVELVMAIEEEFKVEIPDTSLDGKPADVVKTLSIEKLAQIVSEQLRKKK